MTTSRNVLLASNVKYFHQKLSPLSIDTAGDEKLAITLLSELAKYKGKEVSLLVDVLNSDGENVTFAKFLKKFAKKHFLGSGKIKEAVQGIIDTMRMDVEGDKAEVNDVKAVEAKLLVSVPNSPLATKSATLSSPGPSAPAPPTKPLTAKPSTLTVPGALASQPPKPASASSAASQQPHQSRPLPQPPRPKPLLASLLKKTSSASSSANQNGALREGQNAYNAHNVGKADKLKLVLKEKYQKEVMPAHNTRKKGVDKLVMDLSLKIADNGTSIEVGALPYGLTADLVQWIAIALEAEIEKFVSVEKNEKLYFERVILIGACLGPQPYEGRVFRTSLMNQLLNTDVSLKDVACLPKSFCSNFVDIARVHCDRVWRLQGNEPQNGRRASIM